MSITSAQIRGARQLLGWTQTRLSRESAVSTSTIAKIESGLSASDHLLAKIGVALLQAGVEFTVGQKPGVKLRAPQGDGDNSAPAKHA
jgi:transcriptional regulator with XRE-family HTH domain